MASAAEALVADGYAKVVSLPGATMLPSGLAFPLGLAPADPLSSFESAVAWAAAHRAEVEAVLVAHGALFLRGWPVASPPNFDTFMRALGVPPKPYVGGAAVRTVIAGDVFTSNESPPSEAIPFHHEMALVARPPSRIAFFCDTPSASGGETSILPSAELAAAVAAARPAFASRLRAEGLVYLRTLSEADDPTSAQGRGWRSTYSPEGREQAEAAMRATGVAAWEWLPDGGLRTTSAVLPAFREDGRGGGAVFFNALLAVYTGWTDSRNSGPACVRFGGGGALGEEDVAAVALAAASLAADVPWAKGDVMLLDNIRTMHARRPFVPPRRTLAFICE